MNDQSRPLVIRIYFLTVVIFQTLFAALTACLNGFWLGILKRETLHLMDQTFHDRSKMYFDEEYNRRGLWSWERRAVESYFQTCERLLVMGAGGGREVLALRRLGYDVDGFDCNRRLVEHANELLRKEGVIANVRLVPRDQCPDGDRTYDGLIIGWGTYMLIQGRQRRIALLKQLRTRTQRRSPILLSFFSRSGDTRRLKAIAALGNAMRRILRRALLELGDDLAPTYVHHFTREEISSELSQGGFELVFYGTDEYGHAVGIAV